MRNPRLPRRTTNHNHNHKYLGSIKKCITPQFPKPHCWLGVCEKSNFTRKSPSRHVERTTLLSSVEQTSKQANNFQPSLITIVPSVLHISPIQGRSGTSGKRKEERRKKNGFRSTVSHSTSIHHRDSRLSIARVQIQPH
jgi:hypothetical protein